MTLNAAYLDGTGFVDPTGTFWQLVSAANPLPVTNSGGGGGGTGVQDLLFTDDSGTQFIYRDNGAVPPVFTAYNVPAGTVYTPSTNPRPYYIKSAAVTQSTSPWVDNITQIGGANIALGQTTKSASLPVALASDQGALSVTQPSSSTYSAQGGTSNALLTATPVQVGAAGAHSLYGFDFVNLGTVTTYLQIFDNVAGSVTLGTTVPKLVKWIPAGGAWNETFSSPVAFATGIVVAATTTPTGSTAPATGINANINYF